MLPTKVILRIFTVGPSSMRNVRCTSFGPPGTSLISGVTSAYWNPFSFIMSRTMPATFFTSPASMNESRRISAFCSLSFSSIFEVSIAFVPT